MQLHSAICVLALSLVSVVAAQTSSDSDIDAATFAPSSSFASPTAYTTGSYSAGGISYAASNSGTNNAVIAAAIGGSIAASLVVLALGVLFLRYRARRTHVVVVGQDTARRCLDLENQIRALREQVERLELQWAARAPVYVHSKETEVLGKEDGGEGKEGPPTYVD